MVSYWKLLNHLRFCYKITWEMDLKMRTQFFLKNSCLKNLPMSKINSNIDNKSETSMTPVFQHLKSWSSNYGFVLMVAGKQWFRFSLFVSTWRSFHYYTFLEFYCFYAETTFVIKKVFLVIACCKKCI